MKGIDWILVKRRKSRIIREPELSELLLDIHNLIPDRFHAIHKDIIKTRLYDYSIIKLINIILSELRRLTIHVDYGGRSVFTSGDGYSAELDSYLTELGATKPLILFKSISTILREEKEEAERLNEMFSKTLEFNVLEQQLSVPREYYITTTTSTGYISSATDQIYYRPIYHYGGTHAPISRGHTPEPVTVTRTVSED